MSQSSIDKMKYFTVRTREKQCFSLFEELKQNLFCFY